MAMNHGVESSLQEKSVSSLFGNRSFVFLWLSSTTSFLALSTYLFAEQWYIITVLEKESALGIVMMMTMIPRVLFMMIGGVWADRFRRSRIMLISSLVRCLLVLAMILLLQLSLLELWPLIVFALCFGIVDAFFSPANTSLLPAVVAKDVLPRSNSFIQSSNQIALFSGPMLGGWILSIGSFSLLFTVIAGFLLLTLLFSFFIKEEKRTAPVSKASMKSELKEGFSYVWGMPFLKNMLLILIIINFFFFGPLLMGIPLLVDSVLKGQVLDLSFLQSSYQGGMLMGAVLVGILNLNKKRGFSMLVMIGVLGLCLTLLGQIGFLWQGIVLLLVMGVLSSFINVSLISMIQAQSDSTKIGRVMSLVNASSNGLVPLSYAFVSLALVMQITISNIMVLSGIVILIIAALYLASSKVIKEVQ
ncbi:MFS transporter [Planococcus sp. CP5-4]|uniref:MFS transporter n=1 Tax=unclassified Planococcus (in: firmicutes) TaxID=2662419 RepID=UPI001C236EA5|nr:MULTISPECIES: MFS transporter [unclassified Planococcus (in: firmicutes)]MBU9672678.1 MFS transporter [Planococcus sp. CP5-4_YE]MBV0908452.1 MFS transporter [Planococcus sp. CP5-4_UN]MBW6063219.1 MFS transporter [Planococcus sp. CP5-4]